MPSRFHVFLWSALSGLLWALAWPAVGGLTALAFVAWLPLLHAERLHDVRTADRRRAFYPHALIGFFLWNALTTWWFAAVSEPVSTRLVSVGVPVLCNTFLMGVPWIIRRAAMHRFGSRWADPALVIAWLAFERLIHDWDLQWPWLSLGNVFGTRPAWVQWYEFTGMFGGTLWVLLVNLLLNRCIVLWKTERRAAWRFVAAAGLAIGAPLAGSVWRFNHVEEPREGTVEVVVVQPNIDPYKEKFGGLDALEQLERMLTLAEERITGNTRLVVFPETALQETGTVEAIGGGMRFRGLWENALDSARSVKRLRAFQLQHPQVALLCGMSSDRWFRAQQERPVTARPIGDSGYWYEAYNAALWLPAVGAVQSYHKSKLVAGVEQMPFEEWLGPLGDLAIDLGGTTGSLGQQKERTVLHDPSSGLAVVPAICYESVFAEHVAAHVRNGGTLIAVMTNDGWWGDTPGYRQHLAFSSLRAIETRRDVIRSANTGISCLVDQRGVIHQATDWWVPTAFSAQAHPNSAITFFVAHGDLIGHAAQWIAVALIIALMVSGIARRVR